MKCTVMNPPEWRAKNAAKLAGHVGMQAMRTIVQNAMMAVSIQ
jgi:hypothetical protein